MNPHYIRVASRANYRCEYCHAPESVFNFPFEVEHVIPIPQGGKNILSNLALACRSCNLYKGTYIQDNDPSTRTVVSLFHPRIDNWNQHFQVDLENGMILGQTSVGRATISRLRMNSQAQLQARQQWFRLGVFP